MHLKYIDNILPSIQEGYANGVLIQEFLSPQIRKNNNYSFTILPDTYSVNIGILYNMNNELKLNEIFKLWIWQYAISGYDSEIEIPDSAWEAIQNGEDVEIPDDFELQEVEPPMHGGDCK